MALYSVWIPAISTGSSANAFITLAGLKMANTLGHRCWLRRLTVAGAGGATQDVNVSIKIDRTGNAGDGTSTSVNLTTISKGDPNSIASRVNLIGKNYTVEPTTLDGTAGFGGALNSRGILILEWVRYDGPMWGINQTLCILGAPGAATATTLNLGLEWEE